MSDTQSATGETTVTRREWTLPASTEDSVRKAIERANGRAKRAGLTPYTYTVTPAAPVPVFDDARATGTTTIDGMVWPTTDSGPCRLLGWREQITVALIGEVPCYAGWEFVAVIQRDPHAGVLTRPVPGVEVDLSALRERDARECDHCRLDRDRAKVYAVRSTETGQLLQVGSSCVTAFLGIKVNVSDVAFFDTLDDEIDGIGGGGWADDDRSFDPIDVLSITVFMISRFGWIPRSHDGFTGQPTANRVMDVLWPPNTFQARQDAHDVWRAVTDDERRTAAAVLDYARTQLQGATEYERNMTQIAGADRVSARNVAFLASAVSGYNRHVERIAVEAARQTSAHQGVRGERWIFPALKVIRITPRQTNYGVVDWVRMIDSDGNVIVWKASNFAARVGDRLDVVGTVKDHETYTDPKTGRVYLSTRVTRAKYTHAPYGPALRTRPVPVAEPVRRPRKATAVRQDAPAPRAVRTVVADPWAALAA